MKKVIRNGCFETNSSSMHSVTVRGKYDYNKRHISMMLDDNGYLEIRLDEYGWNGDPCDNWRDKLSYALCMVLSTEYPNNIIYDEYGTVDQGVLENLHGYQTLLAAIREHGYCDGIKILKRNSWHPYGYIDHQSCEYNSLQDFLDDWNVDAERYLFDDGVVVLIDNDNH